MNQPKPKISPESSYNRACDSCRQHKVRCLPSTSATSKACQRCEKLDKRPCVFTAPQKRKQRKRTDTRVAELEREVMAMKALFEHDQKRAKPDNGTRSNFGALSGGEEKFFAGVVNSGSGSGFSSEFVGSTPNSSTHSDDKSALAWAPADLDVVDRGVVSMQQAEVLLQTYNNHLVKHYPGVIFRPEVTAEELRGTKPVLFLAVIAAAAGKLSPQLYSILHSEVLATYAHRTVVNGEKSLELVQAMIVTCIWYNPPGKFSRLKFYEYIHMAVTMAIDLNFGTNPRSSRNRGGNPSSPSTVLSDLEIEKRRIYLICFMISSGASMSLRRPNMLRYSSWLDECAETFANMPHATSYDKIMVAWVRLLKITEEIHTTLSLDDLGNVANLSDKRVQLMVHGFDKSLDGWRKSIESLENKECILLAYHHTQISLHEISLHGDHQPEDFKPPYMTEKLFSIQIDPAAKGSHIEDTTACISHIHSLLDILLGMSIGDLRSLPVFTYVRMIYSIVVLTKLYISSKSPQSKIGAVINSNSLRLDFYLDAIINMMEEAAGPMECRAPLVFMTLSNWIRTWYKIQENDEIFSPPTNLLAPLDACWLAPLSAQAKSENSFMNGDLSPEKNISSDNVEVDLNNNDLSQDGKLDYDQEPEMYDEFAYANPDFSNWNSELYIPNPMDGNLEFQAFEWGVPTTS